MYVYAPTAPGTWTVGFYAPDGRWFSESNHDSPDKAAARVIALNGQKRPRGNQPKPTICPRCGIVQPTAREAWRHCRTRRAGPNTLAKLNEVALKESGPFRDQFLKAMRLAQDFEDLPSSGEKKPQ